MKMQHQHHMKHCCYHMIHSVLDKENEMYKRKENERRIISVKMQKIYCIYHSVFCIQHISFEHKLTKNLKQVTYTL